MADKPNTEKATEAGVAADPESKGRVTPEADHDRVVMASRLPDGTPAQSESFEYIGDRSAVTEAAKTQLADQAVSAADIAVRGVTGAGPAGPGEPDAAVSEIVAVHKEAAKAAEQRAEVEVDEHHAGLGA